MRSRRAGGAVAHAACLRDNRPMRVSATIVLILTTMFAGCDRRPDQKDPIDRNTIDHSKKDHSRTGHEMESSPGAATAPYPLQFIDTMIAHHQGAIYMALLADTRAQHAELKTLAKEIIDQQRKEIDEMRALRAKLFGSAAPAINMDLPGMRDGMKGMDLEKLDRLKANDFDLEFIGQMIPHHEGAVEMARDLLGQDAYAELKTLSETVVRSQTAEIEQMRRWREQWKK